MDAALEPHPGAPVTPPRQVVAGGNTVVGKLVPPEFEEFERRGLEGVISTAVRGRILLVCGIASFGVWLALEDPEVWRRILIGSLVVAMAALDGYTRYRFRQRGFEPGGIWLNLGAMAGFQIAMIVATGGLASPLLPTMLPAAFLAGLLLGRWGVRRAVFGMQFPALVMFGALHLSGAFPSLVPAPFRWEGATPLVSLLFSGAVIMLLTSIFGMFGTRIRVDARKHLEQLQSAQSGALAMHRQRADDLTTMTGEIAHELKNPLASVKGLAQLLRRSDAGTDAKARERLVVLEREVVRMQSILDEFLNFSRPLTPLTRAEVSLGPVCHDAVTLHEAMAADRGVRLRTQLEPGLTVEGDARKIAQVLINLLQNALEVAPRTSDVVLRANRDGAGVTVSVLDEGPGLRDLSAETVFEPGVTSKAHGNGLGLTVARGIARQHGGTVDLKNRPSRGCIARLHIPDTPAEAP